VGYCWVINGIMRVLMSACRRRTGRQECRSRKTMDNRFHQYSRRQLWLGAVRALVATSVMTQSMAVHSTDAKAYRLARSEKVARRPRPSAHAHMVNILDYGAIGDGIADDTAAIQAAIDASPGPVFVPATSAALPQFSTFDAISTNNAIGGERWRKPDSATWADLAPFMRQCDQPTI
jgi:hypothetical protein